MSITNHIYWISILTAMFLLYSGCASDPVEESMINVRPDFQPHLEFYIAEASKRGITADFSETGLSIQFREEEDAESSGVCFIGQFRIEIDRSDWNDLSFFQKEGLILHELGHCHLDREHDNAILPNGEWKSRMRGVPFADDAMSPNTNYSGRRRDYYIDELFDPQTAVPDWVNITANYDDVTEDQREELYYIQDDTVEFERSFAVGGDVDFEIELEMNNWETEEFIAVIWGEDNNEKSFRVGYSKDRRFLVVSGDGIWGTLHVIEELDLITTNDYNKLTIRNIDNVCYVFLNEQFIYWFDYNNQPLGTVQSLERGDINHFRRVRVSLLNI